LRPLDEVFTGVTKLQLKGSWTEVQGTLKQKHCQLTIDDLKFEEGEEDELPARLRMVKAPKLGM
jgi:uncharacterized protein YjbJ (UPF0337 family)